VDNQQQFFSITHPFEVSVEALPKHSEIPTDQAFQLGMPPSFKLASQISHLDASALRPLRNLGEQATELSDFLNLQSKKIDLMMSYILTLDEGTKTRNNGLSFGGSHITYQSNQSIDVDTLIELKIFIEEGNCAIYAIGQVVDCQPSDHNYIVNVQYVKISEDDQEQLVRTSLHVQTMQLKQRSDARKAPDSSSNE